MNLKGLQSINFGEQLSRKLTGVSVDDTDSHLAGLFALAEQLSGRNAQDCDEDQRKCNQDEQRSPVADEYREVLPDDLPGVHAFILSACDRSIRETAARGCAPAFRSRRAPLRSSKDARGLPTLAQ